MSQGSFFGVARVASVTGSTGYQCQYNWIQQPAQGCAGYHVCDSTEITRAAQLGLTPGTQCWLNTGTIDWTQNDLNNDDCDGWTNGVNAHYGVIWSPTALSPTLDNCNQLAAVCCCR
jgi:hypothetical protein